MNVEQASKLLTGADPSHVRERPLPMERYERTRFIGLTGVVATACAWCGESGTSRQRAAPQPRTTSGLYLPDGLEPQMQTIVREDAGGGANIDPTAVITEQLSGCKPVIFWQSALADQARRTVEPFRMCR